MKNYENKTNLTFKTEKIDWNELENTCNTVWDKPLDSGMQKLCNLLDD